MACWCVRVFFFPPDLKNTQNSHTYGVHVARNTSMLHYACCSILALLFLDLYTVFRPCISHIDNIFLRLSLATGAFFSIDNSHGVCLHLMLSVVVRHAISLAAAAAVAAAAAAATSLCSSQLLFILHSQR